MACLINQATLGLGMLFLVSMSVDTWASPPETDADAYRIQQLIAQLEADSFRQRERAHQQLRGIGKPAVRALSVAARGPSRERAVRAQLLVEQIENECLYNLFAKFARRPDEELHVEEGMWLISCIADPNVRFHDLTRQLDELADKVRKRFGKFDPDVVEPELAVNRIMEVVFADDAGFHGSLSDYQNPNNSSLYHVLKTRRGLPIMLSHVVVSVGQRMEVPLVGIPVPERYMVKYDGSQAPPGTEKRDIIIDAFGGRLMTVDEVKQLIHSFDPTIHLQPANNRDILIRMLNNIAAHFYAVEDSRNAGRALRLKALLIRHAPRQRK